MENMETRITPEKVIFRKSFIIMTESDTGKYRIPYEDIVWAKLRVWDEKAEDFFEPEITDITGNMDGEIVLYDRQHTKWVIQTDQIKEKAGTLLEGLCVHAPCIVVGGQDWFDGSDEKDFRMIGDMVSLMRECGEE